MTAWTLACNPDGGLAVSDGASDGATAGDPHDADTTPTGASEDPSSATTGEPTGGSASMTGDGGGPTGEALTAPGDAPVCGNGEVEPGEACDDGDDQPGDGCEPGCYKTPVCGNFVVDVGEACDDGNTADDDECSADCDAVTIPGLCGDGLLAAVEACDDGNLLDGDGCEADCTLTPQCGNGLVEPGEACDDGNQINDDGCSNACAEVIPPGCAAPLDYLVCDADINLADKSDKSAAHRAFGICDAGPGDSVQISDFELHSANGAAWQVARGFGTYSYDHDMDVNTPHQRYYAPREGDSFLMISTGVIAVPDAKGVVVEAYDAQVTNNDNFNADGDTLAPPFRTLDGSNDGEGGTPFNRCDGVNDCSDTLQHQWEDIADGDPNDKLWFTFKTKVPAGTHGYSFDLAFCSSEWPSWVASSFNDLFIVYQVDPSPRDLLADPPIDPYTGNVAFISDPDHPGNGLPLTITALDPYFLGPGFTADEPQLKGTGFETHACTEWFTARGGVQPGAELTLGFLIADMGDDRLATVALLDNFRWDCIGCDPNTGDNCGLQPPI